MYRKLWDAMRMTHSWLCKWTTVPKPLVGNVVSLRSGDELREETDILVREIEMLEHELRASRRRIRDKSPDH